MRPSPSSRIWLTQRPILHTTIIRHIKKSLPSASSPSLCVSVWLRPLVSLARLANLRAPVCLRSYFISLFLAYPMWQCPLEYWLGMSHTLTCLCAFMSCTLAHMQILQVARHAVQYAMVPEQNFQKQ